MDSPACRAAAREGIAVGLGQAATWLVVGIAVVRVVPRFERILKDFGTALPPDTQVAITIAQLTVHFWYCWIVLLLLLPPAHYGVLSLLPPRPAPSILRTAWLLATWLAPLVVVVLIAVAIAVPFFDLFQRLS
jgi:hypothetical protein